MFYLCPSWRHSQAWIIGNHGKIPIDVGVMWKNTDYRYYSNSCITLPRYSRITSFPNGPYHSQAPVMKKYPLQRWTCQFPPRKKHNPWLSTFRSAQDVTLPFPCSGGRGLREAGGTEHGGSPYIQLTCWGSSIYHTLVFYGETKISMVYWCTLWLFVTFRHGSQGP